jgi:succinyl-diaminopimelate desuccinylase
VSVARTDPFVQALKEAVARSTRGEVMSVGRDGASEAAQFIGAGIPAVEFGPAGAGHHGPEEWVSVSSLARYRRALADFVRAVPLSLESARDPASVERAARGPAGWRDQRSGGVTLKSIEGGLA